jgi:hypothetical protein
VFPHFQLPNIKVTGWTNPTMPTSKPTGQQAKQHMQSKYLLLDTTKSSQRRVLPPPVQSSSAWQSVSWRNRVWCVGRPFVGALGHVKRAHAPMRHLGCTNKDCTRCIFVAVVCNPSATFAQSGFVERVRRVRVRATVSDAALRQPNKDKGRSAGLDVSGHLVVLHALQLERHLPHNVYF